MWSVVPSKKSQPNSEIHNKNISLETCRNIQKWIYLIPPHFILSHINQHLHWFTYILETETVFLLKKELTPPKLISKWICRAAKQQSSGLFPGTVTRTFDLSAFLYVFYVRVSSSICLILMDLECKYGLYTTYRYNTCRELNKWNSRVTAPGNRPLDCGLAAL